MAIRMSVSHGLSCLRMSTKDTGDVRPGAATDSARPPATTGVEFGDKECWNGDTCPVTDPRESAVCADAPVLGEVADNAPCEGEAFMPCAGAPVTPLMSKMPDAEGVMVMGP